MSEQFFSVFTLSALLWSISTGSLLGSSLVVITLKNPPVTYLSPLKQVLLSVFIVAILGTVFFAGQITQSLIDGKNPDEPVRVFARLCVWYIFSIAVAGAHSYALSFARPHSRNRRLTDMERMENRLNTQADIRQVQDSAVRNRAASSTEEVRTNVTSIRDRIIRRR